MVGAKATFGPYDYCEPTSTRGCCNSSRPDEEKVRRDKDGGAARGNEIIEGGKERKRDREGESESGWLARRTRRCRRSEKVRLRVRRHPRTF